MAGEIVFSEKPGDTLKKWREIFGLSQKKMAELLEINPSVVCDFEKGRFAWNKDCKKDGWHDDTLRWE